MKKGLYEDGYIVNYNNGEQSLQREKLKYHEDIEDQLHTIKQDDTLTVISYNYYGDPLKWFVIADINDIENPFDLEIGRDIIIPNLDNYGY